MASRRSFAAPSFTRRLLVLTTLLGCVALPACGGGGDGGSDAVAPDTSPKVAVTGAVNAPTTYSIAQLQAQPAASQTVSYTASGATQNPTYTGTSLWSLLNNSQVQPNVLTGYVVAKGSDGYRTVFSLAETHPEFGRRGNLVAYQETVSGAQVPLANDGFIRVTAPGDGRGGRYVSFLNQLDVKSGATTPDSTAGGVSTKFSISGAVLRPGDYDLAALKSLPTVSRTVNLSSGSGTETYQGVDLWTFLNTTVGLNIDPAANLHNQVLSYYVIATGSDGYQSLISLGEMEPNFGGKNVAQPNLIAYQRENVDLTGNGFARIVVPGDLKRGRWVSNLVKLEVVMAPK